MNAEKIVQVRFPKKTAAHIKAVAEKKGLTVSAFIRTTIITEIEEEESPKDGLSKTKK